MRLRTLLRSRLCFIVGHIMQATPSAGNTSATNRTKSAKSKKNKKSERNVLEEPFMKNAIYTCHNIQGRDKRENIELSRITSCSNCLLHRTCYILLDTNGVKRKQ